FPPFGNLFFARQAVDGLLRNSRLAERKVGEAGVITVPAGDMYKGFKAVSKILDLIKEAPNNVESAGLLRDLLLAGWFFQTDVQKMVEFLKQGVEVEGHLLARELGTGAGVVSLSECGVLYGGKFGSSGGGGGGVEENEGAEGGEDVDKAVEGFKEALEKKKRSSFGGMGEMGF
ncbi:hypothetical protein TrRE_jg6797, partial [Triparma retinervis]